MAADVDAELDSARQVENEDILQVHIFDQCVDIAGGFLGNTLDTAPQGFDFLLYGRIHASLLSARIRR